MRRVLQIIGGLRQGGAETMIINLYKEIDKSKVQFDFLVYENRNTPYSDLVKKMGGRVLFLQCANIHNPFLYFFSFQKIIKIYGPYDAVHAHMDSHNAYSITAARIFHVPIRICHSHTTVRNFQKGLIRKIYSLFTRLLIIINSTNLIGCGMKAGEALYGKKAFDVIYNPIDLDKFLSPSLEDVSQMKSILGVENKKIIIGMIGRLNREKNHIFMLKLAEEMLRQKMDFLVVFAGDGALRADLENEINLKGLNNNVKLLGVCQHIDALLSCIDVLLMPSLYEGFPVTLIESQTSGVPALISEHITKEVDLGFGLIEQKKLDTPVDEWIHSIKKLAQRDGRDEKSADNRIKVLREKGFDVASAVKKMEKMYGL